MANFFATITLATLHGQFEDLGTIVTATEQTDTSLQLYGNFRLPPFCWIFSTITLFLSEIIDMRTMKPIIFPAHMKLLQQMGKNLKLARKGRKLTTTQVAERAAINRSTLVEIEKGNPSVSMGAYFNTLWVLGLQNDILKLAADDEYGRKLQDLALITK